jgi:hypothetical protein
MLLVRTSASRPASSGASHERIAVLCFCLLTTQTIKNIIDREVWDGWLFGILSNPDELQKALREVQQSANQANAPALEELETFDRLNC